MKVIKESTWTEQEVRFTDVAQNKLEAIRDAGLFDDMKSDIQDKCPGILGVFIELYRIPKLAYSDIKPDELKASRKKMFDIINEYYAKVNKTEDVDKVNIVPTDNPEKLSKSDIINKLIIDEYDAIKGYNEAIQQFQDDDEVLRVLNDIVEEENVHVGQLQKVNQLYDPASLKVNQGESEAEQQINEAMDLHELKVFTDLCKKYGLETLGDVQRLMKDYPNDTPLSAILKHAEEVGDDFQMTESFRSKK